jgi:hypothetical protein
MSFILNQYSEKEIMKKSSKDDWFYISIRQTLSEDIIREFKAEVHWYYISIHQKLSEDFIKEF